MTDDDDLLRLLHATRAPGAPAAPVDLAAVSIARGRRIRRRRTTAAALGSALTASAFVTALLALPHLGGAAVVADGADPSTAPTDSASRPGISSTKVLLQQLGPDFRAATTGTHGPVEVAPGSTAAQGLPDGYGAGADIQVLPTRPAGVSAADDPSALPPLNELCAPSQEKGLVMQACTPVRLSDGRTVQVQRSSLVAGNYQTYGGRWTPGSGDTTTVYYQRPDNSVVRVQLTAYDTPEDSTTAREKKAAAWLPQWTPALERAAADPRVGPTPGPATQHPAPTPQQLRTQQELAALQKALGYGFSLVYGTVELEPGSTLEGALPDRRYGATATERHTDQTGLQATCGTDLTACRTSTLPDGTRSYAITTTQPWQDTDPNAPTPEPGSAGIDLRTTVYQPQADGQVIATTVELISTAPMTAAEQADQTPDDKAWLQALQPRLAAAAHDIAHLGNPTPAPTA